MERVNEMYDFYMSGGYIPQMIHLAEINGEGLVCYDGNHRRELFSREEISKDIEIIVDVLFTASQTDVYKAFENINKSVQVPAIYLVDDDESNKVSQIKREILALVKDYEQKYKSCLSTSARCHTPNFNRDTFCENIYDIYQYFDGEFSISDIVNLLEKLNLDYSRRVQQQQTKYKATVVEKCKRAGLWLFIDRTIQPSEIERIAKKLP